MLLPRASGLGSKKAARRERRPAAKVQLGCHRGLSRGQQRDAADLRGCAATTAILYRTYDEASGRGGDERVQGWHHPAVHALAARRGLPGGGHLLCRHPRKAQRYPPAGRELHEEAVGRRDAPECPHVWHRRGGGHADLPPGDRPNVRCRRLLPHWEEPDNEGQAQEVLRHDGRPPRRSLELRGRRGPLQGPEPGQGLCHR
mmetsp:Transcript_24453/g.66776  ORF Transcript_24453/g.66776 Transcript_24453/m.66776 type:complete len:201 (-) Transcript_24453:536-1138(-)